MLECHPTDRQRSVPNGRTRIAEYLDVFDFEFASEEVAAIDALDTGVQGGPEPDSITLETYGREIPEA